MTFGQAIIVLLLVPVSVFISVRLFYKAKRISHKERHAQQDSTETPEV
jgi:large-conductance mechanosensitive channel